MFEVVKIEHALFLIAPHIIAASGKMPHKVITNYPDGQQNKKCDTHNTHSNSNALLMQISQYNL